MSDEQLRYPMIRRAIVETPWAILPSKLDEIMQFMALKASGGDISPEEIQARFGAEPDRERPPAPGRVAVMPIMGTLAHRMNMLSRASGGESVESIAATFRELVDDPKIDAIVLDVDSPGGSVAGIQELADEIYEARGSKPITAVANTLMASAAYWLASAADEIVATPSAQIGSIGVVAAHEDRSAMMEKLGVDMTLVSAGRYKAENNPYEPMTDEGRAEVQRRVDETYGHFVDAVSRHRRVPVDTVRNGFGEGRVVGAREAVRLGMADRIATIDDVVNTIPTDRDTGSAGARARPGAAAFSDDIELVAADVKRLAQRCRDRIEYRSADGRGLSELNRERLAELRTDLFSTANDLEALLEGRESGRENKGVHIAHMRRLMRNADARLMGIAD